MSEFAGLLNQKIELWERSPVRLPTGASADGFAFLLSCPAAIAAEGAGPESEAMSLSALPRYRITIRVDPAVAVGQQVRWRGLRLIVWQVIADPLRPDRLVLRCEEQR